jgi:hypothetical protein
MEFGSFFDNSFLTFLYWVFIVICCLNIFGFSDFCRNVFSASVVLIKIFLVYGYPLLLLFSYGRRYFFGDWEISRGDLGYIAVLACSIWAINHFVRIKWEEVIMSFKRFLPRDKPHYGSRQQREAVGGNLFQAVRRCAIGHLSSTRAFWLTCLFSLVFFVGVWEWTGDEFKGIVFELGAIFWILLAFLLSFFWQFFKLIADCFPIPHWDARKANRDFSDFLKVQGTKKIFLERSGGWLSFFDPRTSEVDLDLKFAADEKTIEKLGSPGAYKNIYDNGYGFLTYVFSKDTSPHHIEAMSLLMETHLAKKPKDAYGWLYEASKRSELSAISPRVTD